jgi:catechol-2,3-dioxygenase
MSSVDEAKRSVVPSRMAHFVIRTNRYAECVDWYQKLFEAHTVFANEQATFMAFDEEHHRLAIINKPDLADGSARESAIDHVAFSFDRLEDLMNTYERLRNEGIVPVHTLNHGPTTSLYYADPNGSKIELQVDNFPTSAEAAAFFTTKEFSENIIGVPFDAEILLAKLRTGVSVEELLKQGSAPPLEA